MGTRHQPHSAQSCELALRAVGTAHARPGGGASCLGVERLGLDALPPLAARPWGRRPGPAARFPWARGVRAWEHVTDPIAPALASWLCALRGRHRGARGGGRLLSGGVASGVGLSPSPSRPSMGQAAGARCPFSAGMAGVDVGTRHRPHCTRSCVFDLRAVGVARGCSRRGASCLDVGRPGLGALPPPAARPWGRRPGPAARFPRARGVRAWGSVSNRTARALVRWPCTLWGRHEGAGGGGGLLPWSRASTVGRSPSSSRPSMGQAADDAARFSWAPGVRPWGPVTNPTVRALERWLCALWGRHKGAQGWEACCLVAGHPGYGALLPPAARPWGRLPGRAAHFPSARGVWAWGPVTNPRARSCELAFRAVRAARGRPGGGASCRLGGRSGLGALPPPAARPWGRPPGPAACFPWAREGAGVGSRHQPHSARSCELPLRTVGAAHWRPGGGASCLGVGRPGLGALPPPDARPWGMRPGPDARFLGARGVRAWGPVTNPTARAIASWPCAL